MLSDESVLPDTGGDVHAHQIPAAKERDLVSMYDRWIPGEDRRLQNIPPKAVVSATKNRSRASKATPQKKENDGHEHITLASTGTLHCLLSNLYETLLQNKICVLITDFIFFLKYLLEKIEFH